MNRIAAISKLKENEQAIRARGATSLYLFGSTARDEARADSDVDVLVEYDPAEPISLLDLIGIQQQLEDKLKTKVDVSTRDALHPRLKGQIEGSAIKVF